MPSFNFQPQFVEAITTGIKGGTIRQKPRCKPGDTMFLFTGMRTKKCTRIGFKKCLAVVEVTFGNGNFMCIAGKPVNLDDATEFARTDGFKNLYSLFDFFHGKYTMPFTGYWHVWDRNLLTRFGISEQPATNN